MSCADDELTAVGSHWTHWTPLLTGQKQRNIEVLTGSYGSYYSIRFFIRYETTSTSGICPLHLPYDVRVVRLLRVTHSRTNSLGIIWYGRMASILQGLIVLKRTNRRYGQ